MVSLHLKLVILLAQAPECRHHQLTTRPGIALFTRHSFRASCTSLRRKSNTRGQMSLLASSRLKTRWTLFLPLQNVYRPVLLGPGHSANQSSHLYFRPSPAQGFSVPPAWEIQAAACFRDGVFKPQVGRMAGCSSSCPRVFPLRSTLFQLLLSLPSALHTGLSILPQHQPPALPGTC